MAYRKEYKEALSLLAKASEAVVSKGYGRPILVGGGAVEFYSGGHFQSADFDIVSSDARVALEDELLSLGFKRPQRGHILRGVIHPDLLIAVEVVSGPLMDGKADASNVLLAEVDEEGHRLGIILVEDLIADRMGQFCANIRRDREMLDQALYLYKLADDLNAAYLDKRLREETAGEYGLDDLVTLSDENDDSERAGA